MEFQQVLDMVSMNISHLQPKPNSPQNVQQQLAKWRFPELNVIKANVDAATSSDTGVGFGVVFRNHLGDVMASATSTMPNICDPLLEEALAINWAIKTAEQLLFTRVVIESDSQLCIQSSTPIIQIFLILDQYLRTVEF
ncbi:Ribonuclease H-like superfamily [Sesbania bispinosa]|nr:Ribonuclease H-like superfamily [Sesbania bispinosa]